MDLKMIKTNLVTVQDLEDIQALDTYDLPERVFNFYKQNTRWNDFINIEDCKKKLIRNILLSYEAPMKAEIKHKRVFYYGNLQIHVNEIEKSICYINTYEGSYKFHVNRDRKRILNYIMDIKEDNFYIK